MKLKSLFLGSVAAAGLSTTAFAADLSTVVSSFNVCEDLGMSGLTIASADDCLQISGEVSYEFSWGNYAGGSVVAGPFLVDMDVLTVNNNGGAGDYTLDWGSDVDWWLQFVAAAKSDFGTAKAVIKFEDDDDEIDITNEANTVTGWLQTGPSSGTTVTAAADAAGTAINLLEAYVSVGDTTQLVAGRRDTSVFLTGDDEPYNFLGLFHSEEVDEGVNVFDGWTFGGTEFFGTSGHVIQLYHAVGDSGVTISGGLENLDGTDPVSAGSAIGTVAYASDTLSGHISAMASGFLDGDVEAWKVHAGLTGTFDNFKIRGAFAGASVDYAGDTYTSWNGLASAEATFDMFTIAASGEFAHFETTGTDWDQWGFGASASAAVTDTVSLAAGFRWFDADTDVDDTETWQAAVQVVAKLTEALTATFEAGYYDVGSAYPTDDNFYGAAELAWSPGGSFDSSIKGEVNSLGGYKATFKASKSFD